MAEVPTTRPRIMYAMLRHTEDTAKMHEHLAGHLEWMRGNEKAGRVFLSGPAEPTAGSDLNGLTIIEAASRNEADELAQQDPLIRSSAVTYSMHNWNVNEGRIALTFYLSDQSVSLG